MNGIDLILILLVVALLVVHLWQARDERRRADRLEQRSPQCRL